jgi:hypothetical protein
MNATLATNITVFRQIAFDQMACNRAAKIEKARNIKDEALNTGFLPFVYLQRQASSLDADGDRRHDVRRQTLRNSNNTRCAQASR